jgi:hypothetical protein
MSHLFIDILPSFVIMFSMIIIYSSYGFHGQFALCPIFARAHAMELEHSANHMYCVCFNFRPASVMEELDDISNGNQLYKDCLLNKKR